MLLPRLPKQPNECRILTLDLDEKPGDPQEFASLDEALAYARSEVRVLAAESVREMGHLILDHRIDILTNARERVARIMFGDVVKIKGHDIDRKS